MPEIETARLRLRMFTSDDLDDLARLFSDVEVMTYLGVEAGKTMARDETAEVLDSIINGWRKRSFGRWAVIHKEIDQFIGLCGLKMLEGEPELIYVLEKAYWGQGLATEAARATLRYAFEEAKLERIVAVTRRDNVASQRVMKSIGMKFEREGRYYDVEGLGYAISRAEFQPNNSFYILHRS
jgi:ribosomal-protein-alanine N-acetyltransferase